MVSKIVKAKVNELENCVLKPIEPSSSKLDISELPEAEQKLFAEGNKINEWLNQSDYEPTGRDMKIIMKINKRVVLRVIDLFTTWLKTHYCRVNPNNEFLVKARFWYFMFELSRHVEQMDKEAELSKKYPKAKDIDAFEKEFKAWQKTRENQTPLWTRESFSYWFNDTIKRFRKSKRKKVKK